MKKSKTGRMISVLIALTMLFTLVPTMPLFGTYTPATPATANVLRVFALDAGGDGGTVEIDEDEVAGGFIPGEYELTFYVWHRAHAEPEVNLQIGDYDWEGCGPDPNSLPGCVDPNCVGNWANNCLGIGMDAVVELGYLEVPSAQWVRVSMPFELDGTEINTDVLGLSVAHPRAVGQPVFYVADIEITRGGATVFAEDFAGTLNVEEGWATRLLVVDIADVNDYCCADYPACDCDAEPPFCLDPAATDLGTAAVEGGWAEGQLGWALTEAHREAILNGEYLEVVLDADHLRDVYPVGIGGLQFILNVGGWHGTIINDGFADFPLTEGGGGLHNDVNITYDNAEYTFTIALANMDGIAAVRDVIEEGYDGGVLFVQFDPVAGAIVSGAILSACGYCDLCDPDPGVAPRPWTATVTGGYELVTAAGEALPGATVTLTLEARDGYFLEALTLTGAEVTATDLGARTISFTVPAGTGAFSVTVVPTWDEIPAGARVWNATVQGDGALTTTTGNAVPGATVTLTLAARSGFALTALTIEGVTPAADPNLTARTITFEMPDNGTDPLNIVVIPTWEAQDIPTNAPIIIYCLCCQEATINLTAETLHLPANFTVEQRSINGGVRWQNGAVPANFSGLLNRGLTLYVRNVRNPAAGNTDVRTIRFPTIQARPRANHNTTERLAPWYSADTWTLRTRPARHHNAANPPAVSGMVSGATADAAATPNENMANRSYEVWRSGDPRGRLLATTEVPLVWQIADLSNPEFYVAEMLPPRVLNDGEWNPQGERTARPSYWFRLAPSQVGTGDAAVFTPASNAFRIRPALMRPPLNLRPNYALETLRVRFGQEYSIDGGTTWFTPGPSAYAVLGNDLLNPNNTARVAPWTISAQITGTDGVVTPILARTQANGRRARSFNQQIALQPRLHINPVSATDPTTGATEHFVPGRNTETNGRWVSHAFRRSVRVGETDRNIVYTVWNPARSRWVPVPRMTADGNTLAGTRALPVRLNPSARIVSRQWVGHAASETGTLYTTWGPIPARPTVYGVTSAYILPAGVTSPAAVTLP